MANTNPNNNIWDIDSTGVYVLIDYRKKLFHKIQNKINSFTPFEKFLYFDGQTASSASVPGLGQNYVDSYAVRKNTGGSDYTQHTSFNSEEDGIQNVYTVTSSIDSNAANVIFKNQYTIRLLITSANSST